MTIDLWPMDTIRALICGGTVNELMCQRSLVRYLYTTIIVFFIVLTLFFHNSVGQLDLLSVFVIITTILSAQSCYPDTGIFFLLA